MSARPRVVTTLEAPVDVPVRGEDTPSVYVSASFIQKNQFFQGINRVAITVNSLRVEAVAPLLDDKLESKLARTPQRSRTYAVSEPREYTVDLLPLE